MNKDKIIELCKLIEENANRIYCSSDPLSENSNLALVILETIDSIRKELEKANDQFEYKVSWGVDLQTEHERYLCEKVFGTN